mmetsp:Transcript_23238/g.80957  ORF Transcript_23238/g.80957 Transcript_23238/m.80957 type:complete len:369 (+) Transcript_23238:3120-4226(+)
MLSKITQPPYVAARGSAPVSVAVHAPPSSAPWTRPVPYAPATIVVSSTALDVLTRLPTASTTASTGPRNSVAPVTSSCWTRCRPVTATSFAAGPATMPTSSAKSCRPPALKMSLSGPGTGLMSRRPVKVATPSTAVTVRHACVPSTHATSMSGEMTCESVALTARTWIAVLPMNVGCSARLCVGTRTPTLRPAPRARLTVTVRSSGSSSDSPLPPPSCTCTCTSGRSTVAADGIAFGLNACSRRAAAVSTKAASFASSAFASSLDSAMARRRPGMMNAADNLVGRPAMTLTTISSCVSSWCVKRTRYGEPSTCGCTSPMLTAETWRSAPTPASEMVACTSAWLSSSSYSSALTGRVSTRSQSVATSSL